MVPCAIPVPSLTWMMVRGLLLSRSPQCGGPASTCFPHSHSAFLEGTKGHTRPRGLLAHHQQVWAGPLWLLQAHWCRAGPFGTSSGAAQATPATATEAQPAAYRGRSSFAGTSIRRRHISSACSAPHRRTRRLLWLQQPPVAGAASSCKHPSASLPTSTARTLQRCPAHAGCIVVGAPQGPGAYDAYRADIGSIQSAPAVSFARSRREAEGRKRFLSKHHKAEPGPDFSPGPGKNTSSRGQSQHCSLALRNNTPSLPQASTTQSLT